MSGRLLWIGLTPHQCQTLQSVLDLAVEDDKGNEEPDIAYQNELNGIYHLIATAETNQVTTLKAEIHRLRNQIQTMQLEKSLKEKKDE